MSRPSSQNSTLATPRSSLAVALRLNVFVKIEPAAGPVSVTTGATLIEICDGGEDCAEWA